jgi:hypothetical protein
MITVGGAGRVSGMITVGVAGRVSGMITVGGAGRVSGLIAADGVEGHSKRLVVVGPEMSWLTGTSTYDVVMRCGA